MAAGNCTILGSCIFNWYAVHVIPVSSNVFRSSVDEISFVISLSGFEGLPIHSAENVPRTFPADLFRKGKQFSFFARLKKSQQNKRLVGVATSHLPSDALWEKLLWIENCLVCGQRCIKPVALFVRRLTASIFAYRLLVSLRQENLHRG